METENNSTKKKIKSVFGSIIVVVIFILVFAIARWASYEGTTKVIDEYDNNKAKENTVNYFTDSSSWKKFESPVGRFSATFPTYPTHDSENLDIPGTQLVMKYDMYSSETSDGTAYMINTSTYSDEIDVSNPETNLEGALNGMLASSEGNELVSSNLTTFNGNSALDYLVFNKGEGEIYMKGKIILSGQTMCQLLVAYEKSNYNENNYNKFINSLTIK
ncbi:hypothetical protein [Desulfobacter postgatei]|uniref:hypothetical protein n=1 Tax=Desulfobacter postgatei TaxID=2293 RepID=UPI002A361DB2|nr:hypothetical protein [Desulfobacter postgatei]MDX9964278.1 hypothetical protein [Desulfobacter postgatei]